MYSNRFIVGIIFFITMFFTLNGFCAVATESDDLILKTPEYDKHTKGLVIFSHKKHATNYDINCGECHHDSDGKALTSLKEGDSVDRCVVCHKETSKKPKEEKLTKREWIKKYHKKALHSNCKGCHSKFNKTNGLKKGDTGAAPQDCKGCHASKNKK